MICHMKVHIQNCNLKRLLGNEIGPTYQKSHDVFYRTFGLKLCFGRIQWHLFMRWFKDKLLDNYTHRSTVGNKRGRIRGSYLVVTLKFLALKKMVFSPYEILSKFFFDFFLHLFYATFLYKSTKVQSSKEF